MKNKIKVKGIIASLLAVAMIIPTVLTGCSGMSEEYDKLQSQAEQEYSKLMSEMTEPTTEEPTTEETTTEVATEGTTAFTASSSNYEVKVHYLDVGQGDSIFIELGKDKTMLIDAAESAYGKGIVSYINDLGYNSITYLVATHPHSDHIGGMSYVLKHIDVENMYMPKKEHTTKTFENLLNAISDKGLKIKEAKSGVNIVNRDYLTVDILSPDSGSSYDDLNNYSAVIKMTYGNKSFLFMGDAEKEIESNLSGEDLSADVLKVGHHGSSSSSSSSFLSQVNPTYAIISVGEGNSYGHPTDTTLNALENVGAKTYRTDKDGTVVITCDGDSLDVDTSAPSIKATSTSSSSSSKSSSSSSKTSSVTSSKTENSNNNGDGSMVYVTASGKKYHCLGCKYLKSSKIEISLSDAKSQGYEPCKVCNPPK